MQWRAWCVLEDSFTNDGSVWHRGTFGLWLRCWDSWGLISLELKSTMIKANLVVVVVVVVVLRGGGQLGSPFPA
jgi:hypothetical protein